MNGVLRDAVRMSADMPGYPLGVSELRGRTVHNLHVTPDIGPGGDNDASSVSKGTDRGGN